MLSNEITRKATTSYESSTGPLRPDSNRQDQPVAARADQVQLPAPVTGLDGPRLAAAFQPFRRRGKVQNGNPLHLASAAIAVQHNKTIVQLRNQPIAIATGRRKPEQFLGNGLQILPGGL